MHVRVDRSIACASILVLLMFAAACGQPSATSDSSMEATAEQMEPYAEDVAAPVPGEPAAEPTARNVAENTPEPVRRVEEPAPSFVVVDLPAGTEFEVELLDTLSSGTNQVGDPVLARLMGDLYAGDRLVALAGAEVQGIVTEVVPLKKFGGQPSISVVFESLESESGAYLSLVASASYAGKKQAGRDAAKIAGGAAAGAVVGHQVDDDKGTELGALIGGAIGTAVAAKTGKEVELAAGTAILVALESDVQVRLES